mmetsp:Transcript_87636/g.268163  ORF Transcript_87636/g.268163 Transcript_87636/m.268163 type:complete len:363 (+) Transcript_87636:656-1744(+)
MSFMPPVPKPFCPPATTKRPWLSMAEPMNFRAAQGAPGVRKVHEAPLSELLHTSLSGWETSPPAPPASPPMRNNSPDITSQRSAWPWRGPNGAWSVTSLNSEPSAAPCHTSPTLPSSPMPPTMTTCLSGVNASPKCLRAGKPHFAHTELHEPKAKYTTKKPDPAMARSHKQQQKIAQRCFHFFLLAIRRCLSCLNRSSTRFILTCRDLLPSCMILISWSLSKTWSGWQQNMHGQRNVQQEHCGQRHPFLFFSSRRPRGLRGLRGLRPGLRGLLPSSRPRGLRGLPKELRGLREFRLVSPRELSPPWRALPLGLRSELRPGLPGELSERDVLPERLLRADGTPCCRIAVGDAAVRPMAAVRRR